MVCHPRRVFKNYVGLINCRTQLSGGTYIYHRIVVFYNWLNQHSQPTTEHQTVNAGAHPPFWLGRWESDPKAITQLMSHLENYTTAFIYEFDIQMSVHHDIFHPDHASRQPTELAWQTHVACIQCWDTTEDGQCTCLKNVEYFTK